MAPELRTPLTTYVVTYGNSYMPLVLTCLPLYKTSHSRSWAFFSKAIMIDMTLNIQVDGAEGINPNRPIGGTFSRGPVTLAIA